jgi:hypothetical protein
MLDMVRFVWTNWRFDLFWLEVCKVCFLQECRAFGGEAALTAGLVTLGQPRNTGILRAAEEWDGRWQVCLLFGRHVYFL